MNIQYKKITLLSLTALLFFSCSKKLDQTPKTDLSDVNFWNNTNDMKLACNYLYTLLPPIDTHTDDVMSADAFGLSANSVSDGSWLPPSTSDAWTSDYGLIRACNNILEKSGKVVGGDDVAAQTRQVFRNMQLVLDAAGASFADILKVTVYLLDVNDRAKINPVRKEFFGDARPASTLIGIKELAIPGMKVEIEAVVGLRR